MAIPGYRIEEQRIDLHALTRWSRRRTLWSWPVRAAIVIVAAVSLTGSSGLALEQPTSSTHASSTPPPAVLAALQNLPSPLRTALVKTLEARSFEMGSATAPTVYNAPDKLVRTHSIVATTCSGYPPGGTGFGQHFLAIIRTTNYYLKEQCPGAKLSIQTSSADPASRGLTNAQALAFGMMISILQGSADFVHISSGFTFQVKQGAFPPQDGVDTSNGVLGEVQIQRGYVTDFVYFLQSQLGKPIKISQNMFDFDAAPAVGVPTLPK